MKRIILAVSGAIFLAVVFGVIYLNTVFLPTDLKAAIVNELERATNKSVSLGVIKFDIFKGIVLKDLAIYDQSSLIINAKDASFRFLIIPFLKKEIFIPSIRIESPEILVERRQDGSLNLGDLIPKDYAPRTKFKVILRKIIFINK